MLTRESMKFEYLEKENILFAEEKEKRKIFGEGEYMVCRGKGKGGKYLEMENLFFAEEMNIEKENLLRRKIF